jgi:parallel beta-helix repeat protein
MRGLIQGNDIKNNGASGICVMLNASPRIIGNHIHSNMHHGLLFNHGGKGLVQVCALNAYCGDLKAC